MATISSKLATTADQQQSASDVSTQIATDQNWTLTRMKSEQQSSQDVADIAHVLGCFKVAFIAIHFTGNFRNH